MTGEYDFYACPFCKGALEIREQVLRCPDCNKGFPIVEGIPDFIAEEMAQSSDPLLQRIRRMDRNVSYLAGIYESRWWYPLVINLYMGRNTTTFAKLVEMVRNAISVQKGVILDVACGPGTYGRRIASPACMVYGIDISMSMLRKGIEYLKRDRIRNVKFARTRAETLPFPQAVFDAAICSGSLHLFPDPLLVLQEINRTMKPGTSLAVMTFVAGDKGLLRHQRIRQHIQESHAMHVFEISELENSLTQAGFVEFTPRVFGSGIFFTARKSGSGI